MATWDTWADGSGMALKGPTAAWLTNYKMLLCAQNSTDLEENHFQGGACGGPRSVYRNQSLRVTLDASCVPSEKVWLGGS